MLSLALTMVVSLSGNEIVQKMIDFDMYGFNEGDVTARVIMKDKAGRSKELVFSALSYRYDPPQSKSILRFSAPADLTGAGFLQVQKKGEDDERFLYLPEIKKARRIGGNLRSGSFMGTDFTYADIDARDMRDSNATILPEEPIAGVPCYVLDIVPKSPDAVYAKLQVWARKDNFMPLKMRLFDKNNTEWKTLEVKGIKKAGERSYAARTIMTNIKEAHTSELLIEKLVTRKNVPDSEFTVRNLEKL